VEKGATAAAISEAVEEGWMERMMQRRAGSKWLSGDSGLCVRASPRRAVEAMRAGRLTAQCGGAGALMERRPSYTSAGRRCAMVTMMGGRSHPWTRGVRGDAGRYPGWDMASSAEEAWEAAASMVTGRRRSGA